MTTYEIFSGVMLAFNDFHMERYECDFVADRRMLAIDHCREGRMDYAASDNLVAYTAAGGYEARFARAAHGHVPLSVLPLPWADGRVRPKHCERVAAVRGQGLSRDAGEDCRALAARQHAACRPRGGADGAHLRRDVPRAGKDPHPVLQGQDFRAAALPRRDDYSAGGKRASVLLQNAGRKGRGHQALF